jgi:hypothetical protein
MIESPAPASHGLRRACPIRLSCPASGRLDGARLRQRQAQHRVFVRLVACPMMFCLASRDFDLSIGSTVAFSGVL